MTEIETTNPDGPLPGTDALPPRGAVGAGTERRCSRVVSGVIGSGEVVCGEPAVVHVIWELVSDGAEQGMACAAHAREVTAKWRPLATHPVGPDCGMPGSQFFLETNECRSDGPEVAEPVRTLAVAEEVVSGV